MRCTSCYLVPHLVCNRTAPGHALAAELACTDCATNARHRLHPAAACCELSDSGSSARCAAQGREGVKGLWWFSENDLKSGSAIKMDKSGRAVLMVMRHLGRLQEVRCNVQGAQLSVYVLNSPVV